MLARMSVKRTIVALAVVGSLVILLSASPILAQSSAPLATAEDSSTLQQKLQSSRDREARIDQSIRQVEEQLVAAQSDAENARDVLANGVPSGGLRVVNSNDKRRQEAEVQKTQYHVRALVSRRRELTSEFSSALRDVISIGQRLSKLDSGFHLTLNEMEQAHLNRLVGEASDAYHGDDSSKPDMTRAFALFTEAARFGSPEAEFSLGIMHLQGDGRKKDRKLAAEWFRKAASAGHAQAMKNLADMLWVGDPLPVDKTAAISLYSRAIDAGNFGAAVALAQIQSGGNGIAPDAAAAHANYRRAAVFATLAVLTDLRGYVVAANAGASRDAASAYSALGIQANALAGDYKTLVRQLQLPKDDLVEIELFRVGLLQMQVNANLLAESELLRRKAVINGDAATINFATGQISKCQKECNLLAQDAEKIASELETKWTKPTPHTAEPPAVAPTQRPAVAKPPSPTSGPQTSDWHVEDGWDIQIIRTENGFALHELWQGHERQSSEYKLFSDCIAFRWGKDVFAVKPGASDTLVVEQFHDVATDVFDHGIPLPNTPNVTRSATRSGLPGTDHATAPHTNAAAAVTPLAVPVGPSDPAPPVAADTSATLIGSREMTIDSKEGVQSTRVSIGSVKKGQTVTFQYVRGAWTAFPRSDFPPGSPDDVPLAHSNVLPLRFCEYRGGQVVELGTVPGGTKTKPFVFTADHDIVELVLNNSDSKPNNNRGEVVYKITVGNSNGSP